MRCVMKEKVVMDDDQVMDDVWVVDDEKRYWRFGGCRGVWYRLFNTDDGQRDSLTTVTKEI